MTRIRARAFANRIEEFLTDSSSYEEKRFDSSLFTLVRPSMGRDAVLSPGAADAAGTATELHGLCFGAHIELVMILLAHAYRGLRDRTTLRQYSRAMAAAMQSFAGPIAVGGRASFPDPNFLLHGINRPTLAAVVRRFEDNGRIIHETIARQEVFVGRHGGQKHLAHGLKMLVEEGAAEDCFGLCCYITREEEPDPHGTDTSYIAKVSFFLDDSRKEIYVITIQGQRVHAADRDRSRSYARFAAALGMDPRAFVLRKVCELAKGEGYERIKVIRPEYHPMFLDSHAGFMARYEPVIRQAGIGDENGCYLQSVL